MKMENAMANIWISAINKLVPEGKAEFIYKDGQPAIRLIVPKEDKNATEKPDSA